MTDTERDLGDADVEDEGPDAQSGNVDEHSPVDGDRSGGSDEHSAAGEDRSVGGDDHLTTNHDQSTTGDDRSARDDERAGERDNLPESADQAPSLGFDEFLQTLESRGRPIVTADEVARTVDVSTAAATDALARLAEQGTIDRLDVERDPVVWFPSDYRETAARERLTVFPNRRQIVVDSPTQFTRARLSQFARLVDTNQDRGYIYEVREGDVWNAPHDDLESLRTTVRSTLGGRYDALEEWIESQWNRAHKFRLATHNDGYVVLEARSADLLGNVAMPTLADDVVRARIDETTAWIADDRTAALKRSLYEAGYPVQDHRHLESGDTLEVEPTVDLRPYQADWVARFADAGSGILVGPPGSGKTVAATGIISDVGGETLILVPSRELAAQWRESLLTQTTLSPEQVGEYHGGEKNIRPVTIATYRTAGMDRHRMLFDSREWGLIVFDECQHLPAPVSRRSASLQTRHRLGLSATPVRGDDKEEEIYTLIGPPIGTDWDSLFEAGYVAEPEVELRYLPWASETHSNEYGASVGHEKRQLAASNPAKIAEIEAILKDNRGSKALVFVEYIEQGERIAEALSAPFVSGETPHARRSRLYAQFRRGDLDTLVVSRVGDEGIDLPDTEVAIAASGLGGSRRQGAQRAGRTMRPVGKARVYVLATRGTREEDFARERTRHLAARGVRVREGEPVAFGSKRIADSDQ
ncbi:MAG: DEAD/DEAH box helicase [Natronomonas sp.]